MSLPARTVLHSWSVLVSLFSCEQMANVRRLTVISKLIDSGLYFLRYTVFIPINKWRYAVGYTGVSRQSVRWLVCWWNVVSQTPPTVFKSSKWILLHMIRMKRRGAWHILFEVRSKGSRVMPLLLNSYTFCICI